MTEKTDPPNAAPGKSLSAAARRALEEAESRRKARKADEAESDEVKEINGPRGEEPTRYNDWERKGIAYDF
jgi:hypothetical protein